VTLIYQLIIDPQQNPADHMVPLGIRHLGFLIMSSSNPALR